MKIKLCIEADYNEDLEEIQIMLKARELLATILQTKEFVRGKLKHDESLTEKEELLLQEIFDRLYIDETIEF